MISIHELAELKAGLSRTGIYVLDVETHKTETFDGKELLGVALGIPDGIDLKTYYVSPEIFATLHDLLQGKEMIGFSLMFDLEILEQNGYVHNGFIWDVLIMFHLCDENEFAYSLDHLSQRYLRTNKGVLWGDQVVDIQKLEKIYGWNDIPTIFMAAYSRQDVELTWRLFLRVRGELEKQGLSKVYRGSARYVKALQHLVQTGLVVDWELLDQLSQEALAEMYTIEQMVSFPPSKRKQLEQLLYDQMKLPVLKTTKGGAKAQDNEALRLLANRYPEHKKLLVAIARWRFLAKQQSTWYEGFKVRKTAEGRIHPGVKQHGTVTGRLSGAEPNLQQIPRDADRVRKLFVDPPGLVLVEFDYSQIELRAAAYYAWKVGKDPTLYDLYREGEDVHAATGKAVGAYEQLPSAKSARQLGKTINFALLYGAGFARLQNQLFKDFEFTSTLGQCEEWHTRYHSTYPGLRNASYRFQEFHRKNGYIELWNRRRSRIRSSVPGLPAKHHDAWNRLIQGGCSQFLMYSTIKIDEAIQTGVLPARLCNSVHDSLWFYIDPDELDKASLLIMELMSEIPEKQFGLPFPVDGKVLNNSEFEWQDGHWTDTSEG